jgi:hypothetical protein
MMCLIDAALRVSPATGSSDFTYPAYLADRGFDGLWMMR